MKKNYIVPATMVQSVDMDNLMAASGGIYGVYTRKPQLDDDNNQFSKQHYSVWGDDEEQWLLNNNMTQGIGVRACACTPKLYGVG